MDTCQTCKYYDNSDYSSECRRHAPVARHVLTMDQYHKSGGMYPIVIADSWCGDWEVKLNDG